MVDAAPKRPVLGAAGLGVVVAALHGPRVSRAFAKSMRSPALTRPLRKVRQSTVAWVLCNRGPNDQRSLHCSSSAASLLSRTHRRTHSLVAPAAGLAPNSPPPALDPNPPKPPDAGAGAGAGVDEDAGAGVDVGAPPAFPADPAASAGLPNENPPALLPNPPLALAAGLGALAAADPNPPKPVVVPVPVLAVGADAPAAGAGAGAPKSPIPLLPAGLTPNVPAPEPNPPKPVLVPAPVPVLAGAAAAGLAPNGLAVV